MLAKPVQTREVARRIADRLGCTRSSPLPVKSLLVVGLEAGWGRDKVLSPGSRPRRADHRGQERQGGAADAALSGPQPLAGAAPLPAGRNGRTLADEAPPRLASSGSRSVFLADGEPARLPYATCKALTDASNCAGVPLAGAGCLRPNHLLPALPLVKRCARPRQHLESTCTKTVVTGRQ